MMKNFRQTFLLILLLWCGTRLWATPPQYRNAGGRFAHLIGERLENAEDIHVIYLGPEDWKKSSKRLQQYYEEYWVEDLSKKVLTKAQLTELNEKAQGFHQTKRFEKARFYTIYVDNFRVSIPDELETILQGDDPVRNLFQSEQRGISARQVLQQMNDSLSRVLQRKKKSKQLSKYPEKLVYVTGNVRVTDSKGMTKDLFFFLLYHDGVKLGGMNNRQYLLEQIKGGDIHSPYEYLDYKIPRIGRAMGDLLERDDNGGVTASFDVEWKYTSDTEMAEAGITSGQNTTISHRVADRQVELLDYTGVFSRQAIQDLRLHLGLGSRQHQLYQQSSQILIRVTNTQTEPAVIHALNDFQPGSNTMLVWLHHNGEELQSSIRFGEGLKEQLRVAEQRDELAIQEFFDTVMAKTIDLKQWKSGANFFEPLIAMSDFMVYAIKQLQLPEAAWNPQQNTWLAGLSKEHKLRWAFIAGMYNGALQEVEGVPALINLLAKYFYDKETFDALNSAIASLRELDTWVEGSKKIYQNAIDKYSKSRYHTAHQSGRDMVAILSIVIPLTKSGKLAKLADLKAVFRSAIKFKPSARWMLDWAKKGYLTLKKQGDIILIYADRAKTKLLFEIEQGMLSLKVLDQQITGGQLLGGIDEAVLITLDNKTIRTRLELYKKEELVYAKTDKPNGKGGDPYRGFKNTPGIKYLKKYEEVELIPYHPKRQGREKEAFMIQGEPDRVLVKFYRQADSPADEKIIEQINNLKTLQKHGVPTVEIYGVSLHQGSPCFVAKYYHKDYLPFGDDGFTEVANIHTLQDIMLIRKKLLQHDLGVEDIQFLISKRGRAVIHDPEGVSIGVGVAKESVGHMESFLINTLRTVLIDTMKLNYPYSLSNLRKLLKNTLDEGTLKDFLEGFGFIKKIDNHYYLIKS